MAEWIIWQLLFVGVDAARYCVEKTSFMTVTIVTMSIMTSENAMSHILHHWYRSCRYWAWWQRRRMVRMRNGGWAYRGWQARRRLTLLKTTLTLTSHAPCGVAILLPIPITNRSGWKSTVWSTKSNMPNHHCGVTRDAVLWQCKLTAQRHQRWNSNKHQHNHKCSSS